jgi:hypothetical protein
MWCISALLLALICISIFLIGWLFIYWLGLRVKWNKARGWVALIIVGIICSSFLLSYYVYWWDCKRYEELVIVYHSAIEPYINEEVNGEYIVSCNVAYRLERFGYTVEDWNTYMKDIKNAETNILKKYINVQLDEYMKPIVINGSCFCE